MKNGREHKAKSKMWFICWVLMCDVLWRVAKIAPKGSGWDRFGFCSAPARRDSCGSGDSFGRRAHL